MSQYKYNNKNEFLTAVRDKYPQYNEIEDGVLYDKLIEKYPQYNDYINPNEPNNGHDVTSFITKYAPPVDISGQNNNQQGYLDTIKQYTGADPQTPLTDVNTDSLMKAIATQEGFYNTSQQNQQINNKDTSLAQEWNNAGMLEYKGQAGATPSPEVKDSKGNVLYPEGRFAVFPTPEEGFNALRRQIDIYKGTVYADPNEEGIDLSYKLARNNALPDGHKDKVDTLEMLRLEKIKTKGLKDSLVVDSDDPVKTIRDYENSTKQIDKSGLSGKAKTEAKEKAYENIFKNKYDYTKVADREIATVSEPEFDYTLEDFNKDSKLETVETDLDKQLRELNKAKTQLEMGKASLDVTDPNLDPNLYERRKREIKDQITGQAIRGGQRGLQEAGIDKILKDQDSQREQLVSSYSKALNKYSKIADDLNATVDLYNENLNKIEKRERPESVDPAVKEELNNRGAIIDGHYFYDTIKGKIVTDPELAQELNSPEEKFNKRFDRPHYLLKIDAETDKIADDDRLTTGDVFTKPSDLLNILPFIGGAKELVDASIIAEISFKLNNDMDVSDDELMILRDFNDVIQREVSWGNMTLSGVSQLLAFIGELYATGGILSLIHI